LLRLVLPCLALCAASFMRGATTLHGCSHSIHEAGRIRHTICECSAGHCPLQADEVSRQQICILAASAILQGGSLCEKETCNSSGYLWS
jgi:hypothetical protein